MLTLKYLTKIKWILFLKKKEEAENLIRYQSMPDYLQIIEIYVVAYPFAIHDKKFPAGIDPQGIGVFLGKFQIKWIKKN